MIKSTTTTTMTSLLVVVLVALASTSSSRCNAFSMRGGFGIARSPTSTALKGTASEDAIKYAMEMSEKYGKTSKEAILAWETVEEIDSSDNSAAYEGGLINPDEECDVTTDASSEACKEYNEKMDALSNLLKAQSQPILDMQKLMEDIKSIKLKDPTVVGATPQAKKGSKEVQDAIKVAKDASEKYGSTSKEAILAWETVEEIASADNSGAYEPSILNEEECMTDLEGACEALAEINRMLKQN